MKLATNDPNVFIVEKSEGRVVYETTDGERWEIIGTCNRCGECEVGTVLSPAQFTGIPIGQPGAAIDPRGSADERGDYPVRPGASKWWPNCTLKGKYL